MNPRQAQRGKSVGAKTTLALRARRDERCLELRGE